MGEAVNLLLRPEDLRLWREAAARRLPATVEEIIYKGTTLDLLLRLDGGGRLAATQFFNEADATGGEEDYRPGERVFVDWVHGWETLLPYEG
ncbi:MAG: TOBE domain-containing protein [Pseudomonadota bacterium]|nr:TOBE domain-containing protein [Pseudomonadota bacterium]